MFRLTSFLLLAITAGTTNISLAEQDAPAKTAPLVATIDADVYSDYRAFIAGRNPAEITQYSGDGSRRDVIEVLLLQQALILGGVDQTLSFRPVEGYRDSLRVLAEGGALLRATPAWGDDSHPERFHVSEAIIRNGEFQVGLYTRSGAKTGKLELPLTKYTAVTNHDLKADFHTLQQLGVAHIYNEHHWPTMISMVADGTADVILAPFQDTDGMTMAVDGYTLVPVPEVKVALADSRHWIVSRAHPDGARVFAALTRGVDIQRQRGDILRAYTESGFFHPEVSDWPLLNPVIAAHP